VGLCVLSIVTLGIVVLTIQSNKKLRESHPNSLIVRICLAEALLSWSSLFRYLSPAGLICYLKLYDLWGWTLWWSEKFRRLSADGSNNGEG
jgi:hypothetical protein